MKTEIKELNTTALNIIKGWANIKAGEFPQEWSEDDELQYRKMYGESLMALPEEWDDDEEE